jgi:hypothetical protein
MHLVLASLILGSSCGSDRGDTGYDTSVANPAYGSDHPKLAFDEGHRERHLSRGTYRPFAELARHDGYAIERIDDPITESELDGVRVLVIACAQGEGETGEAAAFTPSECTAIERWVDSGGGLLLVADAFPFGSAVDSLAGARDRSRRMTADAIQYDREWKDDTQLDFNRENHLLGVHPVTEAARRRSASAVSSLHGDVRARAFGSAIFPAPRIDGDGAAAEHRELRRVPACTSSTARRSPPRAGAKACASRRGRSSSSANPRCSPRSSTARGSTG